MKCPDCGNRLIKISYRDGEYFCPNDNCPANIRTRELGHFTHHEYYGDTQEEINKQRFVN